MKKINHPLAIAMWDFSWLERRWPGAGYEDWEQALDELCDRGYDAVRIDAYPHFHHEVDPARPRTVLPCWNQNDWGTPARVKVMVEPALCDFIRCCAERGLRVGLSSWYQSDPDQLNRRAVTPALHAAEWTTVLDAISAAGLLDHLLYVDLCNEWPFDVWAPFFAEAQPEGRKHLHFSAPESLAWMRESIHLLRERYPDLRYTFSHTFNPRDLHLTGDDLDHLDLLEPHIWMVQAYGSEFYKTIGYHFNRWDSKGYENLVEHGERLYRSDPKRWQAGLYGLIDDAAAWSERTGKPLITTEGWGIVDYKDWPGLDWDWARETTALGVRHAARTGRWEAICTSNFCGPQFVGMWRDIDWHRELTDIIHEAEMPAESRPLAKNVF